MAAKKVIKLEDKTKPNVIVGLDLSLTGTGWSVYDKETKKLTSGVIASKKKGMERLHEIVSTLKENIPDTCEVFIENYGFGSKGQVVYQGELGGLVRYSLWLRGIKYKDIPPTVAKKFMTGTGVCEKSLIMKELFKKYDIDVNNDNEADAIVLGLVGRALHEDLKITKAQSDSLEKVK